METTKKWGDDKTLMALAQVLNCDIEVPSSVDGKFIPPYTALDSIHQTLKIGHIAESHYMALAHKVFIWIADFGILSQPRVYVFVISYQIESKHQ